MIRKIFWLLATLVISANASAQASWAIEDGELFLKRPGQPRRAITLPGWQWAGEAYACPPAVAVGPRGDAIVTSNVLPVLWQVDPKTLAVSVHRLELDADYDKDVGFSGLTYSEGHGAWFAVSELTGTLWRIDPLLRRAQKVAMAKPAHGACSLSMQRDDGTGRSRTLHLDGRTVNLAPDQRSAYLQAQGCTDDRFALKGGAR